MQANGVDWDASWRAASDCIQPGSSCGSQPQEIWHKTRLRAGIPHLRQPIPKLLEGIEEFLSTRRDVAMKSSQKIVDIPLVLDGDLVHSQALSKDFRSCAKELVDSKAVRTVELDLDGEVHKFGVMLRSLWLQVDGEPIRRTDVEISAEMAESLVRLMLSDTAQEARRHLSALGLADPFCMQKVTRCFEKYAVVGVGPCFGRRWRQDCEEPEAGTIASLHYLSSCLNCKFYMTSGCCEHSYATLIATQLLDLSAPWIKVPQKKRNKKGPQKQKMSSPPPKVAAPKPAVSPWRGLSKEDRIQALRALYPR